MGNILESLKPKVDNIVSFRVGCYMHDYRAFGKFIERSR
jgi:hypothetical protein